VQGKISRSSSAEAIDWPARFIARSRPQRVRQVSYVPDAGHKRLIELCHADKGMAAVPLTTEEEGIGLARGAWLGGERSALLMQSSGVGNCINALRPCVRNCGFPLLDAGHHARRNGRAQSLQVSMGQATPEALRLAGVRTLRLERAERRTPVANTAAKAASKNKARWRSSSRSKLIGREILRGKAVNALNRREGRGFAP